MTVRPPQTLFLYFSTEHKRWCVAGALDAPPLEREEFRSYGAARDWADLYLQERNGGQIHCHDKEGQPAITLKIAVSTSATEVATPRLGFRKRPSSLAERRA